MDCIHVHNIEWYGHTHNLNNRINHLNCKKDSDLVPTRSNLFFIRAQAPTIEKERLKCLRVGIYKFLKYYQVTGSIGRRVGSARPSKVTAEIKQILDDQMGLDDDTIAHQLHCLLTKKGYSISLQTILRCQMALGQCTFRGSAYCHLIHKVNKGK